MIKITFPDGSKKEFKKGITPIEIAKGINQKLPEEAVAAKINSELMELNKKIDEDSKIEILTFDTSEGKDVFRHTTAHVMAQAIMKIFPKAKLTIGPTVEEGFYYDVEHESFKPEDLELIEKEMKKIVDENIPIKREELSKKQALEIFKNNPYKIEMIEELKEGEISVYKQGDFVDLCRGPHLISTGKIKAFKLTKIAGAYWRGDANNKQLQRIYGISFPTKKELDDYLKLREESEKRDHRKIGKDLDLFSFHDEGVGFPFFHSKGLVIWNELEKFWREEHIKAGYQQLKTPIILNKKLWEQSGHWDHYKDNMYFLKIDQQDYAIKPMNCPGSIIIYKNKIHSYRELPLRYAEMGLVHRHELSGVLAGLFRVRCFTQDDAHIFLMPEQIEEEVVKIIELADKFYKLFGLEYHMELSTRPNNSMGAISLWNKAENALMKALEHKNIKYKLNPGDGAFYGPKIDFHIKDCLGRTWQCATIQVDFQMPERFDLTYESKDGTKKRPVIIHRVIYGAVERFIGILVEHFAGKFPLWINPVQVKLLPIADRHLEFCKKIAKIMREKNIRVEIDERQESVNKKIRDAQIEKINYMLVVGDREMNENAVNVRTRDNVVHGTKNVDEFIKQLLEEIEKKEIK